MNFISLKKIIVFLFILLLFKPTWILNIDSIGDDELSYWLHASTIAFDFDQSPYACAIGLVDDFPDIAPQH